MSGMAINGTKGVAAAGNLERSTTVGSAAAADALPPPFAPYVTDDLVTSLAIAMMKQKHETRISSDQQAQAAAKAQQDAHAQKIATMHELAEDTFSDALIQGVVTGVGAVASGASAFIQYDGELQALKASALERSDVKGAAELAQGSKALLRDAKLLDVGGKAADAAGKFLGAFSKRDIELDREKMAVNDAAVDRAKAAAESASNESRRAQEDIRETVTAIRQYSAAKTQLQQAAIFRA